MTAIWSRLNTGGAILQNLGNCDVRAEGMCCYFPTFCDPIAKCISSPPNSLIDLPSTFPRCACPDGYQGDGRTKGTGCTNINECEMGLARCSQGCLDLIPGYRCECYSGYRLENDGRTCRDIDECTENVHDCSHICVNTDGGFQCDCPPGYYLSPDDYKTCIDIDECQEARDHGQAICPYHELCVNTLGGYECGCPPGLAPKNLPGLAIPVCEDVDECFNNPDACPNSKEPSDEFRHTQLCENVHAGHLCRCLPGLAPVFLKPIKRGRSLLSSPAIEERLTIINRTETWKTDGYRDLVETDYSDDDAYVTPVIYPALPPPPNLATNPAPTQSKPNSPQTGVKKHPLQKYDDLIAQGTFQFGRSGVSEDRAADKRALSDAAQPLVVAAEPMSPAEVAAMKARSSELVNEQASHAKSLSLEQIKERYHWTSAQREALHCVDVDECKTQKGKDSCGPDADCVNTFRSFECVCRDPDLEFDPSRKQCVKPNDIPARKMCPASYCSSPCVLTANGYYCGCPRGYKGTKPETWEGLTRQHHLAQSEREFQNLVQRSIQCVDIDECAINAHVCGVGCRCKNLKGSYTCLCDENKTQNSIPVDEDYDFFLAISHQFQEAMKGLDSNNEIIRLMNRNEPRHTVVALASLNPAGGHLDSLALNMDRWLVDQVDWSKSEFISLPDDYEARLAELLNSDNLVKDFIKVSSTALRESQVKVCSKNNPCHAADCPPQRPCCLAETNQSYQCLAATKSGGGGGLLFGRSAVTRSISCPPYSMLKTK